jgi:hypothetical protein
MTPYFKSLLYAFGLLLVGSIIGSVLFGCASPPPRAALPGAGSCINGPHSYRTTPDGAKWYLDCVNQPQTAHDPAQSWDQANLKAHDKGCPTAIFVAPNGNLVQCQYNEASASAIKDDGPKYFKTVDEAAIYVVTKIYERSHYYEFGGVIVKSPKGYAISIPTTQHHGMDVSFEEDPESFEFPIVATYHVHPCLKNAFSSVFSPQDLAGSRVTKTPGYVLDECTGAVHYWAPGDGYLDGDAMLKLGVNPIALMQGVQLSPGRIVGTVAVDGAVLN